MSSPNGQRRRIRGGSGLGDSIYLRPIAEHFVRGGDRVRVLSNYPDVFIDSGAAVEPFSRLNVDTVAHYTSGKENQLTTQYEDMCRSAGIKTDLPLRFDWSVKNQELVESLLAKAGKCRMIIVHGGREPMGREDGYARELLPDRAAFDAVLANLEDSFLVQIGKDQQIYPLQSDAHLNGGTSVSDLLDIASVCDGFVGQCSFVVPLSEVFDKPLLAVWASRGMHSEKKPIRTITPKKVLSKPTSQFVMDNWPVEKIQETASAFLNS